MNRLKPLIDMGRQRAWHGSRFLVYPLCILGQVTHFLLVRALGLLVAISQDTWEGGKDSCGAAPSTGIAHPRCTVNGSFLSKKELARLCPILTVFSRERRRAGRTGLLRHRHDIPIYAQPRRGPSETPCRRWHCRSPSLPS